MSSRLNEILESNLRKVQIPDPITQAPAWKLEDGVRLIRALEPYMRQIGAHVGVTGGVLFKGSSQKDLDVIVYPHTTAKPPTLEEVEGVLRGVGLSNLPDEGHQPGVSNRSLSSRPFQSAKNALSNFWSRVANKNGDEKIITVWTDQNGRRVDVFFLDFPQDWFVRSK